MLESDDNKPTSEQQSRLSELEAKKEELQKQYIDMHNKGVSGYDERVVNNRNEYAKIEQEIQNIKAMPTKAEEAYAGELLAYIVNSSSNPEESNYIRNGYAKTLSFPGIEGLEWTSDFKELAINYNDKWRDIMTDAERKAFNYVCNTEGFDKGFEYLKEISSNLDSRYVANERSKDSKYAHEHPILASIGSVFKKPIEGIGSAIYAFGSLLNGTPIQKSRIYSSADTMRGTVSQDIKIIHGNGASFMYDISMSMADTGLTIVLNTATGGTMTFAVTTGVMGSSVFNTTLNDAIERGLDDAHAVALATFNSVVEGAMESYSLSHLVGLEKSFEEVMNGNGIVGKSLNNLIDKLATKGITRETAENLVGFGYALISQSLVEGDEELCTELVDALGDFFISGDLSQSAKVVEDYKKSHPGCSEAEANLAGLNDLASNCAMAYAGGVVSGSIFGSAGSLHSIAMNNYYSNYLNAYIDKNIIRRNSPKMSVVSASDYATPTVNQGVDVQEEVEKLDDIKIDTTPKGVNPIVQSEKESANGAKSIISQAVALGTESNGESNLEVKLMPIEVKPRIQSGSKDGVIVLKEDEYSVSEPKVDSLMPGDSSQQKESLKEEKENDVIPSDENKVVKSVVGQVVSLEKEANDDLQKEDTKKTNNETDKPLSIIDEEKKTYSFRPLSSRSMELDILMGKVKLDGDNVSNVVNRINNKFSISLEDYVLLKREGALSVVGSNGFGNFVEITDENGIKTQYQVEKSIYEELEARYNRGIIGKNEKKQEELIDDVKVDITPKGVNPVVQSEKANVDGVIKLEQAEKINLEMFETEIDKLKKIYSKMMEEAQLIYKENNSEEETEKFIKKFLFEHYLPMQERLLSYDLSEIPFEAWKDVEIISTEDYKVDFSKSKANIDFKLFSYYGNGNFKGCNVRNLEFVRNLNPEEFDEKTIQKNSALFLDESFSREFRDKYYSKTLTIFDLAKLSSRELELIKQKDYIKRMSFDSNDSRVIGILGLDKTIGIYMNSQQEYEALRSIFWLCRDDENFLNQVKNIDIDKIKDFSFDYLRNLIITSGYIKIEFYPELFIKENADIFLRDTNIPDDVKQRFFKGQLTIQDLIDFHSDFPNIAIGNFMDSYRIRDFALFIDNKYGNGEFQNLVNNHLDIFAYLAQHSEIFNKLNLIDGQNSENAFVKILKQFFVENYMKNNNKVSIPVWLSSLNFQYVDEIVSIDDLINYDDSKIIVNESQRIFLDTLGIDNIKKFERETGFFTHKASDGATDLEILKRFEYFCSHNDLNQSGIDFKNGNLSYNEFLDEFAKLLEIMINKQYFYAGDVSYFDLVDGEFRYNHPNVFIDKSVPLELKQAFYSNNIGLSLLHNYREFLSYFEDKNLLNILEQKLPRLQLNSKSKGGSANYTGFIGEYIKKYGNKKTLELIYRYGSLLEKIDVLFFNDEIDNYQLIEKKIRNAIYNLILKGSEKYEFLETVPEMVREYPNLFVSENVPKDIRRKFYDKDLTLDDFVKNPHLIDILGNSNIALGFKDFSWLISSFSSCTDSKTANYNRLKVMMEYSKINDDLIRKSFQDFMKDNSDDFIMENLDKVVKLLDRISNSNSNEIRNFRENLATMILKTNTPLDVLIKIEDLFIKNNVPTIGKIYSCFDILHPDFSGFDFVNSMISPMLKKSSTLQRKIIAFTDLIKSAFGSNNRSVNNYLNNVEIGSKIFEDIKSGLTTYEMLSEESKIELQNFYYHLVTMYNNTLKGKENPYISTGNILIDIYGLKKELSPDGTMDYNLGDRLVKMFCGFAGIETIDDAKKYVKEKIEMADKRNREAAKHDMELNKGDFVKGVGGITYLGAILQNGSNSKEYLGAADSDLTPLDTDVSMVLSEDGTVLDKIRQTKASDYGPIYFVLKNDERFITTRTKTEGVINNKRDLSKLEVFYTGVLGDDHYGIRTGFGSSEINYIVMEKYDPRVGLEIAMNGFYIPVANMGGKIIFTPEDYDNLRKKMNGLSYYGINDYVMDSSKDHHSPELDNIVSNMNLNNQQTKEKSNWIWQKISDGAKSLNLSLKDRIDLASGSIVLFNTGSTGRDTNLPGDGDFDYTVQVDSEIYQSAEKMDSLRKAIISALSNGKEINYAIVGGDIRELKTSFIDENGIEQEVEIDITFTHKTDKTEYASDVAVSDRLNSIDNPADRNIAKANIILAKQLLKGIKAYKPSRKYADQGGMGGIGVENWILQNGGTLYSAAKSFMEVAEQCSSFEEFVAKYSLPNFGNNHMAEKKNFYPHDDYITNMNNIGYQKMKNALRIYLEYYEQGFENPVQELLKSYTEAIDATTIYKNVYDSSENLTEDIEKIINASFDRKDIKLVEAKMGQTGKMYEFTIDGDTYLAKPGVNKNNGAVNPARAEVQEAASKLQQILSPEGYIEVKTLGSGNVKVAVQKKIENTKSILSEEILIKDHTKELMIEYVVDYLLGNFDSDNSNFIIDENGVLHGIDKEQSFKYLLQDNAKESLKLDFSYSPSGSRQSIYPSLLKYISKNGLSEDFSTIIMDLKSKISKISDEEYIEMFKKYAYNYSAAQANEILYKILERKTYFLNHIDELITSLDNDVI